MNLLQPLKTLLITLTLVAGTTLKSYAVHNTRFFNQQEVVASQYNSFCHDDNGYMWFGTQYGLVKFDGTNFDRYVHDDSNPSSISDNRIMKVFIDADRRLWVATASGLNLYDPESDGFKIIDLPMLDFHGYIIDIFQQRDKQLVFIVSGVGLYVIDSSSGTPVAVRYMPNLNYEREFNSLCESREGSLLVGTHKGCVISVAPNGQAKKYHPSDTYMRGMIADTDSTVLVYSTEKAWRWLTRTGEFSPIEITGDKKIMINNAHLSYDGTVYIGTLGHGVYQIKAGSSSMEPCPEFYSPMLDIAKAKIGVVYEDANHNIWLGCGYRGVIMAPSEPMSFNFWDVSSFINNFTGGINTIVLNNNSLWVTTEDNRLMNISALGEIINTTKAPDSMWAMMRSSTGDIYVGVDHHGIYRIDKSGGAIKCVLPISGRYQVKSLAQDKQGNIYAAFHGVGLMIFNPSTNTSRIIKAESTEGKLSNDWNASLCLDSKGRMWIGLYGGLGCYDTRADSVIDLDHIQPKFHESTCYSIAEGNNCKLWIGTNNGLMLFDPESGDVRKFTTLDGLSDNSISSIVTDNAGRVWLGTMNGINMLDPTDYSITSYYSGNGLNDRIYTAGVANDLRNYIFFTGEKGITGFRPHDIKRTEIIKNLAINGVYVHGHKINGTSISAGRKILEGSPSDVKRINLSYHDNSLALRMSTMDYRDAGNVSYEWRIRGFGDSWITTAPGESTISIPHLQPGKHTLQIRACENGTYSPIKEITIDVESPWYLSPAAKIIYFLVLVLIVGLGYMLIKKKNAEKLNDEKIKFFINVSHEIRSPMTLIISPLESLLKKEHDPDTTRMLQAMHRNAHRILGLINQLLDMRKIEKGKMKLSYSEVELVNFVKDLVGIFKPKADEKHIDLKFETTVTPPQQLKVWIDGNNFDKVLVNLISNALKYTEEGGKITVAVDRGYNEQLGDYAEIKVTDNGIGLDEKNIDHIFERFYQGRFNKSEVPLGFGIGLNLCKQLVELHHGTITAANRSDKGSIFTVRVPIGDKHLAAGQTEDSKTRIMPTESTQSYHTQQLAKKEKGKTTRRIMVVDDDAEIREYLKSHLEGTAKIYTASNGAEAMKQILSEPVDLIVSDVMMPEMDGLTLLKTVKSNVSTNHIPIILLSSKTDIADRMAGWDKGADGYIGKPFNVDELDAMIDNLIDNRRRLRGKYSGAQQQDDKIATPELKGNDEMFVDRITKIINDHLDDPNLNVEKLGVEVGISRAHLHRKMKEVIGMSPSDFIRNARLQRACELLKKRDIDVTQIAYTVGFTSQPHFSTAFKRFTGISPTDYRAQHVNEKDPGITD